MKLIVSLLMVASGFNRTELMMKWTNGTGCAKNEYFSLGPRNAFCCEANPNNPWVLKSRDPWHNGEVWRLRPTVCLSRGCTGTRQSRSIPGCTCKKG